MFRFNIRRAVDGDEFCLAVLGAATFLEAFADDLEAADILAHIRKNSSEEAFRRYLDAPGCQVHLADLLPGNAPVGYIICSPPDLPDNCLQPGDYELRRIYLLHRFQGSGIGRALMDRAIDVARHQGHRRLLLGVYGQNHSAIAFYRKAGFEEIGERWFSVGAVTHHDLVMARPL